jgi:hypothetical protein
VPDSSFYDLFIMQDTFSDILLNFSNFATGTSGEKLMSDLL